MQDYSAQIEAAARALAESDHILIGAGAGLSAAAGLNYLDLRLFQDWYPQFARLGYGNIWDAITHHWAPNDANRKRFWAFWATHIQRIRYDAEPGKPYLDLQRLVKGTSHFVITTNVDGQFVKAGFDPNGMFTPQGDYAMFQCSRPCSKVLYENCEMVGRILANLDESKLQAHEEDIPRCPHCGDYLERNLRRDDHFVEEPYMVKHRDYADFVNRSAGEKMVLLELGVGFNTPGIIRWPFEQIASRHSHATLIRVNIEDCRIPGVITAKSIVFKLDIAQVIQDLVDRTPDIRSTFESQCLQS
jgi:NAD-dependent SIR2 family protein deacetylase